MGYTSMLGAGVPSDTMVTFNSRHRRTLDEVEQYDVVVMDSDAVDERARNVACRNRQVAASIVYQFDFGNVDE